MDEDEIWNSSTHLTDPSQKPARHPNAIPPRLLKKTTASLPSIVSLVKEDETENLTGGNATKNANGEPDDVPENQSPSAAVPSNAAGGNPSSPPSGAKRHRRIQSLDIVRGMRLRASTGPSGAAPDLQGNIRRGSIRASPSSAPVADGNQQTDRPLSTNFLAKLVGGRRSPDPGSERTSPVMALKSPRGTASRSPIKSVEEEFDWMLYESDDDDNAKKEVRKEADDAQRRKSLGAKKPSRWTRLPAWARRFILLAAQGILFTAPAAAGIAKDPTLLQIQTLANQTPRILQSELFLWTLFLEASLLGYHILYFLSKVILTSAKLNSSQSGIGVIFHIEQLSKWMRFVFASTAAFVAEITILHPAMCGTSTDPSTTLPSTAATSSNSTTLTTGTTTTITTIQSCGWAGWWLKNVLGALCVCSVLFFVEKVVLQRIAINFHQKQYAERIRKAKVTENTLAVLVQAKRIKKKRQQEQANLEQAMKNQGAATLVRSGAQLNPYGDEENADNYSGSPKTRASSFWRLANKRSRGPTQSTANRVAPGSNKLSDGEVPANEKDDDQLISQPMDESQIKEDGWVAVPSNQGSIINLESDDGAGKTGVKRAILDEDIPSDFQAASLQPGTGGSPTSASPTSATLPPAMVGISRITGMPDTTSVRARMSRVGVSSKRDACKLARKLFELLCPDNQAKLVLDHFKPYLHSETTRVEFFALFDKDSNKSVSKREFRDGVLEIYSERKNLAESLGHLEMIVGQLDSLCVAFVSLVSIFIWLSFFSVNVLSIFVSFTSVVVALTFVFGNTAKTAFEALILMFLVHPFDVGDKVTIDGDVMMVEHMSILHSRFRRSDGQEVYYPNGQLASKIVTNMRRSGDMWESLSFEIRPDTTAAEFQLLRSTVGEYVKREPADWTGKFEVMPQEMVDNGNRLKVGFSVQGRGNWMDSGKRWARKSRFFFFVTETLANMRLKPMLMSTISTPVNALPYLHPSPHLDTGRGGGGAALHAAGALVPIATAAVVQSSS